jgi:hypothetical protein
MDDNKQAFDTLTRVLRKLGDADESGVHLTMEEAALLVAWLKEAGLAE